MPADAPPVPARDAAPCVALAADLEASLTRLWALVTSAPAQPLSRTAAAVLAGLRDDGPLRVTDLARRESVAQPTMTTMVARLRREGLVEGTPDPDDARAVLLTCTAAGRAALQARVDGRVAVLAERLSGLDAAERAVIAGALAALDAVAAEVPA